jgi:hypothetical protein
LGQLGTQWGQVGPLLGGDRGARRRLGIERASETDEFVALGDRRGIRRMGLIKGPTD